MHVVCLGTEMGAVIGRLASSRGADIGRLDGWVAHEHGACPFVASSNRAKAEAFTTMSYPHGVRKDARGQEQIDSFTSMNEAKLA